MTLGKSNSSSRWRACLHQALLAFVIACMPISSMAASSVSTSFTITRSTVAGGGISTSASYGVHHSHGQSTATGPSASASFSLYAGFIAIPDSDGDTILDNVDNCLNHSNGLQINTDGDIDGDACDTDDDNDGLSDTTEAALGTNPLLVDSDGDTLSDFDEVNADGNPGDYQIGVDTDPKDPDTDGDGLDDAMDPEPLVPAISPDGDLAPYGAPDGLVNAADLLIAQRIVLGLINPPTPLDLAHGDVYPPGAPDGVIDMSDLLLIQKMVLNLP